MRIDEIMVCAFQTFVACDTDLSGVIMTLNK